MPKICVLLLFIVFGCNDGQNNKKVKQLAADSSKNLSADTQHDFCFSKAKKDTVLLSLHFSDSVVSGNLSYHIFEKDANEGKIEGRFYGDTLIANYQFMSEGLESERSVAFLIKDSLAIEGYGEMKNENGRMQFANRHQINFDNGIVLQKIPCNNLEKQGK